LLTKICECIEGGCKKKYGALGTVFSQTVLGAKQGWRYIRGVTNYHSPSWKACSLSAS